LQSGWVWSAIAATHQYVLALHCDQREQAKQQRFNQRTAIFVIECEERFFWIS